MRRLNKREEMSSAFFSVMELFVEKDHVHGKGETRVVGIRTDTPDLFDQFVGRDLVGIDTKHPVVGSPGYGKLFLRTIPIECTGIDIATELLADGYRIVGAVTVHNNDLIAPVQFRQCFTDDLFFIESDDHSRNLQLFRAGQYYLHLYTWNNSGNCRQLGIAHISSISILALTVVKPEIIRNPYFVAGK